MAFSDEHRITNEFNHQFASVSARDIEQLGELRLTARTFQIDFDQDAVAVVEVIIDLPSFVPIRC